MKYKITLENLELQHELGEYILELEEEEKSPKTILKLQVKKIQPAEYFQMFPEDENSPTISGTL